MPPKKPTPSLEQQLGDGNAQRLRDNMDLSRCIVCDDQHTAWECTKTKNPLNSSAWISKAGNITDGKARIARDYVAKLQKQAAAPAPAATKAEVASSQQGPTASNTSTGQDPANQPAKVPGTDAHAEADKEFTDEDLTQDLDKVTKMMEDMVSADTNISPAAVNPPQFPFRNGSCKTISGSQKAPLLSNFYKIDVDPETKFYEYDIRGLPLIANKRRVKKLIETMISHVPVLYDNKDMLATDHVSTIISWKKLHSSDETDLGSFEIPDGKKDDGTPLTRSLQLRHLRDLDFTRLRNYVSGQSSELHLWDSSVEVKALNILVAKSLDNSKIVQLGDNKFFVIQREERLSPSLTTMQGYFYTIKPLDGSILLNVNYGTSAFYAAQLVSEFLKDTETFPDESNKYAALSALRVSVEYGRGKTDADRKKNWNDNEGRQRTIQGTSKGAPISSLSFKTTDDKKNEVNQNVVDYFVKKYEHTFTEADKKLPGINLGTAKGKEWFSSTRLRILPHQIYRRPVPDHLTETMLERAAKAPTESIDIIKGVFDFLKIESFATSPEVSFEQCSPLKITPQMLKVDGAVIHYPAIFYKGNATINLYNSWTGGTKPGKTPRWTLMGRRFLEDGLPDDPGISAFIIEHENKGTEESAKALEDTIRDTLRHYNVGNANKNVTIKRISLRKLEHDQLREALSEVKEKQSDGRKKLVFLILPGRDRFIYPAFKDMADREFGLQAICMTEGKLFSGKGDIRELKKVEQYLGNVMMKANIKCGGINHTAGGPVDPKSMGYMTAMTDQIKDTMLLGADVTHPSVASIEGCPSIAAMVGSVDNRGGKFLGSMRLQDQDKKDREIIQNVESMVKERLEAYWDYKVSPPNGAAAKTRAKLPKRIIYYRDGVSESQYSKVVEIEVSAIKRAFEKLRKMKKWKDNIKVTTIVVTKRHHTRFYPIDKNDEEGKCGNCQPGTVVDTTVTSPYFKEFFLQSHSGLQGTTKPAHYFVVQDDMKWDVGALAAFTHQLSYTYVRSTCGVSYAPPAYYADRLCERGRIYLRDFLAGNSNIHESLRETKTAAENVRRRMRDAKFKPEKEKAIKDTKVWPRKSRAEEVMEVLHRDQVAKICREQAMGEAKKVWGKYVEGARENPWKAALDGTMFWM